MFVSVEELDSPACPDNFQEMEVKDGLIEYDAVSCDLLMIGNALLHHIMKKNLWYM